MPTIGVGVPGCGLTVTVVEVMVDGPQELTPSTDTVAVPLKFGSHVTVPVCPVPEMVFPVPVTYQL